MEISDDEEILFRHRVQVQVQSGKKEGDLCLTSKHVVFYTDPQNVQKFPWADLVEDKYGTDAKKKTLAALMTFGTAPKPLKFYLLPAGDGVTESQWEALRSEQVKMKSVVKDMLRRNGVHPGSGSASAPSKSSSTPAAPSASPITLSAAALDALNRLKLKILEHNSELSRQYREYVGTIMDDDEFWGSTASAFVREVSRRGGSAAAGGGGGAGGGMASRQALCPGHRSLNAAVMASGKAELISYWTAVGINGSSAGRGGRTSGSGEDDGDEDDAGAMGAGFVPLLRGQGTAILSDAKTRVAEGGQIVYEKSEQAYQSILEMCK